MKPFNTLRHAWNAFVTNEKPQHLDHMQQYQNGYTATYNMSRTPPSSYSNKRIATSICNKIAMDAASISIRHVIVDENARFKDHVNSGLDYCLRVEANIDQSGRAFLQDIYASMLDEGHVAIVPVDTSDDATLTGSYHIHSMRTGRIVQWYPQAVTVNLYNDRTGYREDVTLPKSMVGIVENPLYTTMNQPNSTMQRLLRKLSLLDTIDEDIAAGSMNLLIQVPYATKTAGRQNVAEERRAAIEAQLSKSRYGVAYIDGTEQVTQLNRPMENNLLKQIDSLTKQLHSELGITPEIMNGTADAEVMTNYYSRTIESLVSAVAAELGRKFLTKTARTQHQAITFFMDPFKLVPIADLPDVADKFTRNEIMSTNEFRTVIGMKPSNDPAADELRNKNLSQSAESVAAKNMTAKENRENKKAQKIQNEKDKDKGDE